MAQGRVNKRAASRLRKVSKVSPSNSLQNVDQYVHDYEKRPNNPPVGLVTPETDREMPRKRYEYDPHLDPQLQWAGKKENTSFEVDTVSLHVHERIDPLTIIERVRKKQKVVQQSLSHYFDQPENNPPLREAIDFYKHSQNWSNRLIAGDSLLVMNSLLLKERMAGKVQTIYIDPPYGIKYGSNFQPFVNKRQVNDGKDEDLTQEPEMIKAFRDTWELGIHSYLSYLRDRLLLARELLHENGSIFVQISDTNVHHVKELMDEIFLPANFVSLITFRKTSAQTSQFLPSVSDYIIWFARDKSKMKYHQLFVEKQVGDDPNYSWIEDIVTGERKRATDKEIATIDLQKYRLFRLDQVTSQTGTENSRFEYQFEGKSFVPVGGRGWSTSKEGLDTLANAKRLAAPASILCYVRYFDDFPVRPLSNLWLDTASGGFLGSKRYVVETTPKTVQRCILMTTDPGDLIFDPTCGSGTTAYVAEQWGRRWITCDTSRVAIAIAKQRLMTSVFDYYELADPSSGVNGKFRWKNVPHITLRSIANKEPPSIEVLYDQPLIDNNKVRVSGPFTVEAVPAPVVRALDTEFDGSIVDDSLARAGETTRQEHWRSELLATGILGGGAEKIEFSRIEPLQGTEWLHADAETKEKQPRRVVVSFGPDYAPLEQRQVARAIEEAQSLVPRPKIVLFAAFQFDPEAAKDIDELRWEGVNVLRAQMNTDLLTDDLKKKVSKSQSFWLMGQPDIELKRTKDDKYLVEVHGFDYYNPKTHEIESGDKRRIAMWMLDTDYDGRSLYPQQVFFPMAGEGDGWSKIGKSIKAEIDARLLEKYTGTLSLPFDKGFNRRLAVKIIDDRGIESLRILKVK